MPADTQAHRRSPTPGRQAAPGRSPARRGLRPIIALLAIALAAVVLAACGGSSGSGSGSGATTNSASITTNSSGATTNSTGAPANSASTTRQGGSARFASVRSCLQKEGVNLPSASAGGAGRPFAGGPPNGAAPNGARHRFKLPGGMSRAKFQEALKKCGAGFFGHGRPAFSSAAMRASLAKYAECMRANGVDLPAPNTSGKGPVFDTKGIDTASATFKAAREKCQSHLRGAFGAGRRPGGGYGGPRPGGGYGGPPPGGYGPPPGAEAEAG